MKALEVKNLSVTFEHHIILEKIDFEVEDGDSVAVIGPNGAGKTTLFKAILNLIHYSGEIHIYGEPNDKALDLVGFVPQHFHFDRTLPITVKEFLQSSVKHNLDYVKILPSLQELDVEHLQDRLLGKLSGGELQRILVARAIFNDPKILLMDEPLSGIDIVGQKEFMDIVKHLNEVHKTTILIVTHDIAAVPKIAKKILALNRHLVFFGPTEEFFKSGFIHKLYHYTGHIFHDVHHQ